jgi:hypothetical protein
LDLFHVGHYRGTIIDDVAGFSRADRSALRGTRHATRATPGVIVAGLAAQIIDSLRQRECRCNPAMRDDEGNPRDSVMKLFDALGSAEKTLHANPGGHFRVPSFEIDSSVRFFARHLGSPGTASSS